MSSSELVGAGRHVGDEALYRGKVGMVCLFLCEAHMFGCLIVAYLIYFQDSKASDTPPQAVLSLATSLPATICLLASSPTSYLAMRSLRRDHQRGFALWWGLSMILGAIFLVGTGLEWYDLIVNKGVTLGRNYFGTTYYPLVGLHAAHVTIGIFLMLTVLGLVWAGKITTENIAGAELVDWYWHFVDAVWIVIFSIVYLAAIL